MDSPYDLCNLSVNLNLFQNKKIIFKCSFFYFFFFFRKGGEREKERKRNIDMWEEHVLVASHMHPTGDLAHNPSVCSDWESNGQPFHSQAGAQPTESQEPGLNCSLKKNSLLTTAVKIYPWIRQQYCRAGVPGSLKQMILEPCLHIFH